MYAHHKENKPPQSSYSMTGNNNNDNQILSLESALMYDSLLVLATAAKHLEYSHMDSILFKNANMQNVSCTEEVPWMEGTTFFNYLNAVNIHGITGNISFQVSLFSCQLILCLTNHNAQNVILHFFLFIKLTNYFVEI